MFTSPSKPIWLVIIIHLEFWSLVILTLNTEMFDINKIFTYFLMLVTDLCNLICSGALSCRQYTLPVLHINQELLESHNYWSLVHFISVSVMLCDWQRSIDDSERCEYCIHRVYAFVNKFIFRPTWFRSCTG